MFLWHVFFCRLLHEMEPNQCRVDDVIGALQSDRRTAGRLCYVDAWTRSVEDEVATADAEDYAAQEPVDDMFQPPFGGTTGNNNLRGGGNTTQVVRYPGPPHVHGDFWTRLPLDQASAVVVFRNVVDGWSLGTVKAAVSLLDLNESAAPIVVVVAQGMLPWFPPALIPPL